MQSSLKKSLYLGLAALSFASVASVTANASNANAAKKHAAAKKVTYKTTNKNLDQTVVFKSTGKNAIYNKPVGKRSVKASLDDMKSKANSKNTGDLFMAYQEGVTSKGVHYYKVVSFDKKVRGFVYNKGVAKVDGKVAADKPSNTVGYLNNTNRFFTEPYGSQFKTNVKNDYKGMNLDNDQFTVKDSVKVNASGQVYYYVTDNSNQLVNGWVNSVYFQNNITPAAQKNIDSKNAIHVKVVDKDNLGSLVSSFDVQPNNGSYDGKTKDNKNNDVYSNSQLMDAVKAKLVNSGYNSPVLYNINNGSQLNPSESTSATVQKGNDVTVTVAKNNDSDKKTVAFYPQTINFDGTSFASNAMTNNMPALSTDQQNELTGYANNSFDMNKIINDIFASGKAWNTIKDGNTTYTFDKDATMRAYNQLAGNNTNMTFADAVKNGYINVYYTASTSTQQKSDNNNGNSYVTNPTEVSDKKAFNDFSNDLSINNKNDALNMLKQARNFGFALANNKETVNNKPYVYNKDDGMIYNATISSNGSKTRGEKVTASNKGTDSFGSFALAYNTAKGIDNGRLISNSNLDDLK